MLLWVDMVLSTPSKETGVKKGQSIKDAAALTTIRTDPAALRAVVSLDSSQLTCYVLINPVDGVCETRLANLTSVFYFAECRGDEITSVKGREKVWNRMIRDHLADRLPATAGEAVAVRASQGVIPPRITVLGTSVRPMSCRAFWLAAFLLGDDEPRFLDEAVRLLEQVDNDLTYKAPQDNLDLHMLFDLELLWLELESRRMRPEEIILLAKVICAAGLAIEHAYLRGVLVSFVRYIRDNDITDGVELSYLVAGYQSCYEMVVSITS